MKLHIESAEAERLALELAKLTGESVDAVVTRALENQLAHQREIERVRTAVREISKRVKALPVLDDRTPDEILGYDEYGFQLDRRQFGVDCDLV